MSREAISNGDNSAIPTIEQLPKTALQAIYHAVTGKVENLSKVLDGNVLISSKDIDNLHQKIKDQLDHYTLLSDPTTTIIVRTSEGQTHTYSSWARYCRLRIHNQELTSEISFRIEFVTQLPNTVTPQRCIISFSLDSSLPIITEQRRLNNEVETYGFLLFSSRKWRTVEISIDFVDFLIAKLFVGLIQEWFNALPAPPSSKIDSFLISKASFFRNIVIHLGRLGMSIFIGSYLLISETEISIRELLSVTSIGLIIWSIFSILGPSVHSKFLKRISGNVVPTVILTTDKDHDVYSRYIKNYNSSLVTISNAIGFIFVNISLNIFASFIYDWSK